MPNDKIRMSIVGNIYYQVPGVNPSSFSLKGKRFLTTEEEPYLRSPPKPLGQEWQSISLGWLESCSTLCVRNNETPDTEDSQKGLIEIDYFPIVIPPGMTTIIYPRRGFVLRLRCAKGSALYTVYALPE